MRKQRRKEIKDKKGKKGKKGKKKKKEAENKVSCGLTCSFTYLVQMTKIIAFNAKNLAI